MTVAFRQGGTAEAVISSVIETIDSTINYGLFIISKWSY
jgi:hypothetical protein